MSDDVKQKQELRCTIVHARTSDSHPEPAAKRSGEGPAPLPSRVSLHFSRMMRRPGFPELRFASGSAQDFARAVKERPFRAANKNLGESAPRCRRHLERSDRILRVRSALR